MVVWVVIAVQVVVEVVVVIAVCCHRHWCPVHIQSSAGDLQVELYEAGRGFVYTGTDGPTDQHGRRVFWCSVPTALHATDAQQGASAVAVMIALLLTDDAR